MLHWARNAMKNCRTDTFLSKGGRRGLNRKTLVFLSVDSVLFCLLFVLFGDFCVSVCLGRISPYVFFLSLCCCYALWFGFFVRALQKDPKWKTALLIDLAAIAVLCFGSFIRLFISPLNRIHLLPLDPDCGPGAGIPMLYGFLFFIALFIFTRAFAVIFTFIKNRHP